MTEYNREIPQELLEIKDLRFYDFAFDITPCIYFLCRDKKVVYVGKTTMLPIRVNNHVMQMNKIFDEVCFLEVEEEILRETEKSFIEHFNPEYNKTL